MGILLKHSDCLCVCVVHIKDTQQSPLTNGCNQDNSKSDGERSTHVQVLLTRSTGSSEGESSHHSSCVEGCSCHQGSCSVCVWGGGGGGH